MSLQFLKLGGSLITQKHVPQVARPEVLARLANEIHHACQRDPSLRLVLGHGSGSFGHVSASRYGTRRGVHSPQEWLGFVEVWRDAQALNRLVVDILGQAGLPVIGLSPLASVTARDGKVVNWDLAPLQSALQHGLIPVVYGDVIFDLQRGGTILSTEDLFFHLAEKLAPHRILLAGIEAGVWADFPACTRLIEEITLESYSQVISSLAGAQAADVTGGMASKVQLSLDLVKTVPGLEILIFPGEQPGLTESALAGSSPGTMIH
ncbi:MAG: isopentenyl phosphate kinase [Anaerolineales bacterium]|jgi:isopentenyl phosphate kinase|nr:isopentenyl phosphate kinase [Anaerolineales bacterium]